MFEREMPHFELGRRVSYFNRNKVLHFCLFWAKISKYMYAAIVILNRVLVTKKTCGDKMKFRNA